MINSSLLSVREKEVAELLLLGQSNKQIATTLNITVYTVGFHLTHIYRKIGVASRSEAILALAKIQLEETTGDEGKGELEESIVEIGSKAVENAKYPILRKVPMKRLIFLSFGLLAPALVVFLILGASAVVFRPDHHSEGEITKEAVKSTLYVSPPDKSLDDPCCQLRVHIFENAVLGFDFPQATYGTVTIDDPATPLSPDYTGQAEAVTADWGLYYYLSGGYLYAQTQPDRYPHRWHGYKEHSNRSFRVNPGRPGYRYSFRGNNTECSR